jgi:hypothetical protein
VAQGEGAEDPTRPLYEIVYNTDRTLLPRETEDLRSKLSGSFKITE